MSIEFEAVLSVYTSVEDTFTKTRKKYVSNHQIMGDVPTKSFHYRCLTGF